MVQLIKAIILDSFKFKETSVVCNAYSQEYGMMSVMASGLGKKSNTASAQIYFQPLTLVEFSVNYKEKKGILRASNIHLLYSPIGIVPDVRKYAISFFIAEIIIKTCREKEQDEELFFLLESTLKLFEHENFRDIHLYFLVKYIHLLGFSLKDEEYIISNSIDYGNDMKIKEMLLEITSSSNYIPLPVTKNERLVMLKFILQYLELNTGIAKLKSLQVLEDIFA